MEGFENIVVESWGNAIINNSNAMVAVKKKLQFLKGKLRFWVKIMEEKNSTKLEMLSALVAIDVRLDWGVGGVSIIEDILTLLKSISNVEKFGALDLAQKAKVQWAIDRDEISKYFHGFITRRCSQRAIHGVF